MRERGTQQEFKPRPETPARGREQAGMREGGHWREQLPRPFLRSERADTTIWMAGLTQNHDAFIAAAARGLGYRMETLPTPDNEALGIGKEYGNRGQCNPTYYTVGNLIRRLQGLESAGYPRDRLINDFVLFTASSCGPCRFGMYATEYRKALREAGYEGFRIETLLQNDFAHGDRAEGRGIEFDLPFIRCMLKALLAGDMLNILGHRIRPYEVEPGATDRAMDTCREIVVESLENQKRILPALRRCRKILGAVLVDRLQAKPKVAVIGEIWAMTTEGDGNYRVHRFLEDEGAEVTIQPIYNWILYLLWEQKRDIHLRRDLRADDAESRGLAGKAPWRRLLTCTMLETLLRFTIRRFAQAAGCGRVPVPDVEKLAIMSRPYYDTEVRGGETFLEVGEYLDIAYRHLAHLVVSVKPFGCMPSSGVSDGVQTLAAAALPETAFYAIETTGDGRTSVHSRIQMMLFKARQQAESELESALAERGMDTTEARRRLLRHPRRASAIYYPPHRDATTAANLVRAI